VLRRAVERGFEAVLGEMFARGAFAGATPAQGFRVVADETVNPPREVEAGRLVVELRVAPSVPLSFLSVRLAERGGRLAVDEEL
jgi:phage tail sheath protein FI